MTTGSTEYLQSVVSLGVLSQSDGYIESESEVNPVATAFLYAYPGRSGPNKTGEGYGLWLVTCAHVIRGVQKSESGKLVVRMNRVDTSGMYLFETSLWEHECGASWFVNPDIDIAVLFSDPHQLDTAGVRWKACFSGQDSLTREGVVDAGLYEGHEVLIVGFPTGWREGRQDYPVVRRGVFAQIQGWLNEDHDTFLVDGSGFPGNSGGPIVTELWHGSLRHGGVGSSYCMVGMVSHVKSMGGSEATHGFTESVDLIEAVPVDAIEETIRMAIARDDRETK